MCQVNIVDLLIIYINLLKLRTKVLVEFTYEIIYNPIKVTNLFSCCSWLIPTTTLGGVIRHGWRCACCRVETLSTVRQKQNRKLINALQSATTKIYFAPSSFQFSRIERQRQQRNYCAAYNFAPERRSTLFTSATAKRSSLKYIHKYMRLCT